MLSLVYKLQSYIVVYNVSQSLSVRSVCVKQQRLLQEKEAKRAQLDERHHYIFQTIADCLGLEKSEIDDFVLDGNQVVEPLYIALLETVKHEASLSNT